MTRFITLAALLSFTAVAVPTSAPPVDELVFANLERPPDVPGIRVASAATLPSVTTALFAQAPETPAAEAKPVVHTEMLDVAFGALTLVLSLLARYLFGKSGESKVVADLSLVTEAVRAAVAEANVALKPKLKSFLADGKIDEAEALELKNDVVKLVQAKLPPGLWRTVVGVFGGFADTWIRGQVERAVIEAKAAEAAAKVITPADAAEVLR